MGRPASLGTDARIETLARAPATATSRMSRSAQVGVDGEQVGPATGGQSAGVGEAQGFGGVRGGQVDDLGVGEADLLASPRV